MSTMNSDDGLNSKGFLKELATPQPTINEASIPIPQLETKKSTEQFQPRLLKVGEILAGKYQILEVLGAGTFGTAYKARDTKLGQLYVVKQLVPRSGDAKALDQETKMLVALNQPGHPAIPPIYERLDAEHCLIMKYIEAIEPNPIERVPWSESRALRYLRDSSSALAYMHEHEEQLGSATPKLHRDIKPDHLLLDRRKHLWLIDFGLARSARGAKGIAGTLDFMAPEQKQGNHEPRSDVYSLGKTFENLTGQDGNNKSAKLSKQFKWLLKQSTDPVARKRPTAAWLANTIDQLIALRRARLQLVVALIGLVTELLIIVALFFAQTNLFNTPKIIGLNSSQPGQIKEVALYEDWSFTAPSTDTFQVTCTPRETLSSSSPKPHPLSDCDILIVKAGEVIEHGTGDALFNGELINTYAIRVASGFDIDDYGAYSLMIKKAP